MRSLEPDLLTAFTIIVVLILSILVFGYLVWRHVRRHGMHRIWVFAWPIMLAVFSLYQIFGRD
ncbi:hypothetical protein V0U79_11325 [Hyphobacterium sp. HN65]|uniref:Cardiolipin synthase N-terminal domain-containing protein n=1 Tax=Hyphobacterium lacteum TaxID=3116575 RepID=A0ABU7LSR6_9PROT|nr:hypothetical protein [Hyphobacterium sp. HN65]MEE2526962.1 hypothetical protein [Hyphobacterium sp. HN65]